MWLVIVCVSAPSAWGQIAPDCTGVVVPADYSEDYQQSYLQNYFAAGFLLTPMAAPVPFALTKDAPRASVSLELGWIPPLSCERRLVLNGTKTEQTNKSPVNPRPRVRAQLPSIGPVTPFFGVALMPPVPTPLGTFLQVGGELGAGYRHESGFSIGVRAHLDFARVRSEIAEPFNPESAPVEDLFFANVSGADVGVAYSFPIANVVELTPYLHTGIADISTLFIVGDDLLLVQNTKTPWAGALTSLGVQALWFNLVDVAVEGSWAIPLYPTVKVRVGVAW
jgi:hypothetical protein